jgi:hypothetical protein
MHPLMNSLNSLTDDELHTKHGKVQKMLFDAQRQNNSMKVAQLNSIMYNVREEISRRNDLALSKQQKNQPDPEAPLNIG